MFTELLSEKEEDDQFEQIAEEFKRIIKKAKDLAHSCDQAEYEQIQYETNQGVLVLPQYKEELNYNQQFWKRYSKNQINLELLKEYSEKVTELQKYIQEIEQIDSEYEQICKLKNRKKNRRPASEIQKRFECPYERCYRVYGSDVSLNLHIKLKHNGGNKTDREKLAEAILFAEENNLPPPQMKFNLPKGFLDVLYNRFRNID